MNFRIPKVPEKKKYEWLEHDLMMYYDDLKYKDFTGNMGSHFSMAKIVNFNIIHHECHGDKLKNPRTYYETICNNDFKNYEDDVRNRAMPSAIKSERDEVCFEHHLLKSHLEKDLISNGFFITGRGRGRKRATKYCKSLKHSDKSV